MERYLRGTLFPPSYPVACLGIIEGYWGRDVLGAGQFYVGAQVLH